MPVDATPSRSSRQQARRQGIVDAALALLHERDYEKIQVRDVAESAGVALGTFYRYFSSKEHLFAEAMIAWAATLRTGIGRNPLRGTTDAERLVEVLHRSVRAFQREPQLARLVATLETSSDPFVKEFFTRLGQATTPVYAGALHDVDPERAHAIVRVVDAVLASSLRSWVTGRIPMTRVYDNLTEAVELLLGR